MDMYVITKIRHLSLRFTLIVIWTSKNYIFARLGIVYLIFCMSMKFWKIQIFQSPEIEDSEVRIFWMNNCAPLYTFGVHWREVLGTSREPNSYFCEIINTCKEMPFEPNSILKASSLTEDCPGSYKQTIDPFSNQFLPTI